LKEENVVKLFRVWMKQKSAGEKYRCRWKISPWENCWM